MRQHVVQKRWNQTGSSPTARHLQLILNYSHSMHVSIYLKIIQLSNEISIKVIHDIFLTYAVLYVSSVYFCFFHEKNSVTTNIWILHENQNNFLVKMFSFVTAYPIIGMIATWIVVQSLTPMT